MPSTGPGSPPGETIDAPALTAVFRRMIANHRGGGWRELT